MKEGKFFIGLLEEKGLEVGFGRDLGLSCKALKLEKEGSLSKLKGFLDDSFFRAMGFFGWGSNLFLGKLVKVGSLSSFFSFFSFNGCLDLGEDNFDISLV